MSSEVAVAHLARMKPSTVLSFAAALVALVSLPEPARAFDREVRLVLHQRLVGVLNPMGAEHMFAMGGRVRLGDPGQLLFTGAHADAGWVNYTSPIYTMFGGYLEVSPLAFLVLRASILSVDAWPIGMDGAGYYPVQGDDAPVSAEDLPGDRGQSASGWSVQLSAVVQGAVPLGPLRLLLWNQFTAEHLSLGEASFHYYPRYDAILARQDVVLANWGMLLLEVPFDAATRLRVGVYDDLRSVPRSADLVNQLGAIAMLAIEGADPSVPEISPFLRAGFYTHHRARAGEATLLVGALVRYDLGGG